MAAMEKNNKNLNVPNLRFPEFSGEWDITTIGEISNIKNGPFGSVLHAEDYVSDGIPIVTTEHFKSGSLPIVKDGIPQVSEQDYIRLKGYKLQTNDIVFSRVGSVDINAYVSDTQNGWLFSGRVLRVRPISSVNSLCLHFVLSTEKVKQSIRSRAVGQTMPSINTPILSITNIFLPKSLEEQRKISIFLALIDARLETQKKIIEDLKKLKDAIRTKLFRYIENTYTAYDEIRNMLDYEQPTEYLVNSTEYSDSYQTPVLTANKAFILGYTDELHGIYDKGDCIILDDFTMDVKYVTFPFKVKSSAIKILTAKQNVDLYYMYEYIMHLALVSEEHKRHYISEIEPMNITCPPLQEQKQISLMLKSLNMLVDNAKNYQGLLSKQKQYLLTQLFI